MTTRVHVGVGAAFPMALLCGLPLLVGCGRPEVSDEQLRNFALNVNGFNVLHDGEPSLEAGTDFGKAPLLQDGWVHDRIELQLVGGVVDWAAELSGDAVFFFLVDDFGNPAALQCIPPALESYEGLLTFTADSQPGRAFRVPLRCEGSDEMTVVPLYGEYISDDAVTIGNDNADGAGQGVVATNAFGSIDITTYGSGNAQVLPPGRSASGQFLYRTPTDGTWLWDGTQAVSVVPGTEVLNHAWASADASVLLYSDYAYLHRVDIGGTTETLGDSSSFNQLLWASPDARYAVTNAGNGTGAIDTLTLYDTETGSAEPLTRPDGSPWVTGFGGRVWLSPDANEILVAYANFGTLLLELYDRESGALLGDFAPALLEDMSARQGGLPNLTGLHVNEGFTHLAVSFDNIGGGATAFRQYLSIVYVVELDSGKAWLASVDPDGERIRFEGRGFDGRLLEHVALSPDAEFLLYGNAYVARRSSWVEVTP